MDGDTELTDTMRIETFSDGVFAIAITLLVLELHVPELAHGEGLWSALLDEWPQFGAYLTSFAILGIMWINHHSMFRLIQRSDRGLMFLNLNLLLWTALLPFPTVLLALSCSPTPPTPTSPPRSTAPTSRWPRSRSA